MTNTKANAVRPALVAPRKPVVRQNEELKRLNLLRLQEIHILTGAKSSCVLFRKRGAAECLFWVDAGEDERRSLIESIQDGTTPPGWEVISECEGEHSIHLCIKEAVRKELKMAKLYLIHWFAVQKFPQSKRP